MARRGWGSAKDFDLPIELPDLVVLLLDLPPQLSDFAVFGSNGGSHGSDLLGQAVLQWVEVGIQR